MFEVIVTLVAAIIVGISGERVLNGDTSHGIFGAIGGCYLLLLVISYRLKNILSKMNPE